MAFIPVLANDRRVSLKKYYRYCLSMCITILFLFINSCSSVSPVDSVIIPTITQQYTETPTPTVTSSPIAPIQIEGYVGPYSHQLLTLDVALSDLDPNTYMLFFNGESVIFMSLDTLDYGVLGNFSLTPGFYDSTEFYYIGESRLNLEPEIFQYMGVGGRVLLLTPDQIQPNRLVEILVNSVSLENQEYESWLISFFPESGIQCHSLSLSPDLQWIAGNCWQNGENSLYLLNIEEQTVQLTRPDEYSCLSPEYGETAWGHFLWSPDGRYLSTACGSQLCLVSPDTGMFSCRNPDEVAKVFSFSPDGTKVAILANQGITITDPECVGDVNLCTPDLVIPVNDIVEPYRDGNITRGVTTIGDEVIWNSEGTLAVTSRYIEFVLTNEEPGIAWIWIADLTNGTITRMDGPRGARVIAISPDDRWILILDQLGFGFLSMNGQILRRIPGYVEFMGWLVVP